jgi:hypothetical protein
MWEFFNPVKAESKPICPLLALLGAHHILHVSRIRALKSCLVRTSFVRIGSVAVRNYWTVSMSIY